MGRVIAVFFAFCILPAFAQAPTLVDNAVLNAASFARNQAVAPGSLVSIFGDNLATQLASASTVPFSTSLGGVSVTFGGIPAPLRDVVPGSAGARAQINAQLPWNLLGGPVQGSTQIIVTVNGVSSAAQTVPLAELAPGIYSIPPGVGNAIAVLPDGTIAAPVGSIPGFQTRPAKAGEAIFFYANGLGPVDSRIADGADSTDRLRNTLTVPTVVIDGIAVTPLFSGLAPQYPGVNQVNFVVPNGVRPGNVSLQIQIGNVTSPPQVTIAVQ